MDDWYGQGEYDKCLRLTRRLIEIEPLDEGLHDFLIRATTRSAGLGAARAAWWESRRLFEQEVGHVPPVLDSLGQTLFQRQAN